MSAQKLTFLASDNTEAIKARNLLKKNYSDVGLDCADVVVALGGDGFMLQTLHLVCKKGVPVYGMNKGTVGFLMNEFSETDLHNRIYQAKEEVVYPLKMIATKSDDSEEEGLAINENKGNIKI